MYRTRSYAVINTNEKFVNSPLHIGVDASLYYSLNYHQVGVEIFPYLHTNAFYGLDVFKLLEKEKEFKLIPEIKYGYSWILEKHYTGLGIKIEKGFWSLELNRMLHIKSGESNYWGDGLTGISLGFTFNKFMLKNR